MVGSARRRAAMHPAVNWESDVGGLPAHEGRIVLGPRFEAFLKSVSCRSVPTLMFPQKQKALNQMNNILCHSTLVP